MHDNTQLSHVLTWNIMQLNTIYSIIVVKSPRWNCHNFIHRGSIRNYSNILACCMVFTVSQSGSEGNRGIGSGSTTLHRKRNKLHWLTKHKGVIKYTHWSHSLRDTFHTSSLSRAEKQPPLISENTGKSHACHKKEEDTREKGLKGLINILYSWKSTMIDCSHSNTRSKRGCKRRNLQQESATLQPRTGRLKTRRRQKSPWSWCALSCPVVWWWERRCHCLLLRLWRQEREERGGCAECRRTTTIPKSPKGSFNPPPIHLHLSLSADALA